MSEEEAKERLKNKNLYINIKPKSSICIDCINENRNKHIEAEIVINEELEEAIESVLNLLEKKNATIIETKEANRQLSIELQKKDKQIEQYQNMLATNDMLHVKECEKKDKIINSIKEYAQQEIDFATEDIEDYIDDDREGNKDIIGELKEWKEHWKDIIRIMNNEKTYMDFEYKVEEDR